MALKLMEGAVDAVKSYLETNMVAKLGTLDLEYGDFALEDIDKWYVAELTAIPEYPAVVILGDASDIIGEGAGWCNSKHTITVAVMATDQDAERLRRRLYRYIRACLELLVESRASIGYIVTFDRLEFSPLYGRAGTFMSDARLIVKLGKYEV
jgi:hypothetical protein